MSISAMDGPALEARLDKVGAAFRRNFSDRGELGASVSIWYRGEEVLSLAHGFCEKNRKRPWEAETIVPFWSATKGLAAACVLKLLDQRGIALDSPVIEIWPEFALAGKAGITFAQLLSHQAGLPALELEASMFDYEAVVAALEEQRPYWEPGTVHGYHPRTIGFLLDEVVRRIAGMPLGQYFDEAYAKPLDLEAWIGLPAEQDHRVATLYPGRMTDPDGESDFYRAFTDPASLTRRSFGSPPGLPAISGMNQPEAWRVGWPAMGGIGTAEALAKFYSMLAGGGQWQGEEIVSEKVLGQMGTTLVSGRDQVFHLETAFAAGFMKDAPAAARTIFGPSDSAFGHPGAGGSLAFADPENGLAFAYVMNQMNYGVLPGRRALSLVEALYGI